MRFPRSIGPWFALACALLAMPSARAQSADSTAGSEYFAAGPLAGSHVTPFGDLRFRDELADNVPARADRLHRQRATLRGGLRWTPAPLWALELSGRGSLGSDRTAEFFPNVDNEAADTLELDRANLRLGSESAMALRAGRIAMPLRLSETLWDRDLRPYGVAATGRWPIGPLDVARAGAALVNRSEARLEWTLLALQAGWTLREGAERSGEIAASVLVFRNEDLTLASRLVRQNRATAGVLEDMTVGALQIAGQTAWLGVPVRVSVDGLENFRADTDRRAVRTRLRLGSAREHGVEIGWSYQRVEQQALPGAYGSDDWWFRTRMQGHLAWIEIAHGSAIGLRVLATDEHRDDLAKHLHRVVAELTLQSPER